MKTLIKMYLKSLKKEDRSIRLIFIGRRLKVKQYQYLHFNNHPWDDKTKSE